MATLTKRPFNSFLIEYSITNPQGKDLVRIDFFLGEEKAGQALFGDAIAPGAFASLTNEGQIHLFFPISHFQNITTLLSLHAGSALFVEDDQAQGGVVRRGGLITNA